MPRSGWMLREIRKHCARLRDTGLTVASTEDHLRARLMRSFVERKLAELAAAGKAIGADRPAGERAGERRDVLLRVAAVDAERMQLENFPRQILVDPELAI